VNKKATVGAKSAVRAPMAVPQTTTTRRRTAARQSSALKLKTELSLLGNY